MWLKKAVEQKHINMLINYYKKSSRKFQLQYGLKIYTSYINKGRFHLIGYVERSYHRNGDTYLELKTQNTKNLLITAPRFTNPKEFEFQSVLCENIIEHHNDVLNNSIFARTCSKVVVL